MKKWYFLAFAILVFACSSEKTQTVNEESIAQTEPIGESDHEEIAEKLLEAVNSDDLLTKAIGYYVGDFNAAGYDDSKNITHFNKINISVDSFAENTIFGHSVVAGNSRPFTGTYSTESNTIIAEAREPGDDKYDGVFSFTLKPFENEMTGTWNAYNKNLGVYKRNYYLQRARFAYQPELELPKEVGWEGLSDHYPELDEIGEFLTKDVVKKNPSTQRLTKEDVENMYRGDLEIMRNSIYARHGYSFKNRKVRFIFDRYVDWYVPVSIDIRENLTELELANIDLIKRYEEHA
ncbi:MAG: YARHG domain-containing protein, partial [Bacteroidetes bacterium]|nr:YARHG domain-containing protein [Bacteroidota bacterium]